LKLIRFGEAGRERPGVPLDDGSRMDVSDFVSDYNEAFFARGGIHALRDWLKTHISPAARVPSTIRLGPPICRPSKIIFIGLNYRDHAAETGAAIPKEPVIFFKATTSLVGPNDALVIPRNATKVDWGVELALVVGKTALYVPTDEALDYVAGYALHNDYSERSFQLERGGQRVKGKRADTFAPLGPFLASPDELPDASNLKMWLKVNGEIRQNSSTANMIFKVATLLSYVSEFMTLLPGDVISTGTARRGWARHEAASVSQIWRCGRVGD
jgi:2,4-diketo-3-deoxy-L-fuconate hydrolase